MNEAGLIGIDLPPFAPMLMQSLRAVGYTTSAALADLVDNSIAAEAHAVAILFATTPNPFIAIIDDGHGMDEAALVAAMRFGSRDPRDPRTGMDLGRFGLGLKTASLSQCSRLVVASVADGPPSLASWDIDECDRRGSWWLGRPDRSAIPAEVLDLLLKQGQGTAVVWWNLDRLVATGGSDPRRAIEVAIEDAVDHLAMVFHRFLSGEIGGGLEITVNGRPLPRLDPFLEGNARGQIVHPETFRIDGQTVTVSPFVLPFPSRMKPAELVRVGGREGLKTGHGFYVYRGGRLVVPGGWFRIVPSDELIRLARIRVDVPVELDRIWKIDIRKTVVEPPLALRPLLKRIVGDVTLRSRRVYTHKGNPRSDVERIPLWRRHDLREGAAAWRVNREHPAVVALTSQSADVDGLLRLLEATIPVHDIHLHISNDLPVSEDSGIDQAEMEALARRLVDAFRDQPSTVQQLLDRLPITEPFNRDPDAARRIAEKLRQ